MPPHAEPRCAVLQVTQHADCRVRVTILPETQSGAHKISLTSLMAAAYPIFAADTLANDGALSG